MTWSWKTGPAFLNKICTAASTSCFFTICGRAHTCFLHHSRSSIGKADIALRAGRKSRVDVEIVLRGSMESAMLLSSPGIVEDFQA